MGAVPGTMTSQVNDASYTKKEIFAKIILLVVDVSEGYGWLFSRPGVLGKTPPKHDRQEKCCIPVLQLGGDSLNHRAYMQTRAYGRFYTIADFAPAWHAGSTPSWFTNQPKSRVPTKRELNPQPNYCIRYLTCL